MLTDNIFFDFSNYINYLCSVYYLGYYYYLCKLNYLCMSTRLLAFIGKISFDYFYFAKSIENKSIF